MRTPAPNLAQIELQDTGAGTSAGLWVISVLIDTALTALVGFLVVGGVLLISASRRAGPKP